MELQDIRAGIDRVDAQILTLFLERLDLVGQIAEYKRVHHLPILNQAREQEILARIIEQSGDCSRYAVPLFETLIKLARTRQTELLSAADEYNAKKNSMPENLNSANKYAEAVL